jgi:hypothetical protein
MPMDRSGLVTETIIGVDNKLISLVHFNHRQWPLPVDTDYLSLCKAIGVGVHPCNIEIKSDSFGLTRMNKEVKECESQEQTRRQTPHFKEFAVGVTDGCEENRVKEKKTQPCGWMWRLDYKRLISLKKAD